MGGKWRSSTWGNEISLEYGKALRGHDVTVGQYRVFGANGPIGWTSEFLAPGPGVILGRKGAYRGVNYSAGPFFVIDTAYYVVPKSNIDMRWLYYAIRHYKLGEIDDGSPIPSTTRAAVYVRELEIPPLDEQSNIARILGALDDKIELSRRMNETLEAMARGLFKSWFVDFDPVRAKIDGRDPGLPDAVTRLFPGSFSRSEFGNLPAGWRLTSLGDEADRCGGVIQTGPFGSQLHAADYVESGVPVIMPQDLSRRRVSTTKIARIEETDAQRLARHRVKLGDIIYSRRGDVERHALIGPRESGWLCGTGCLLVRMGDSFPSPLFASLALDLPETRAWIVQHAIGATMPNLNTGILARVPMLVPDDALLRKFEDTLRPLAKRIVDNDQNAEVLGIMRDTLLPKLISGELRLKTAEKMVEAVA